MAFPDGQLAEERESVRVQALVMSGHRERAEEVADAFRARYPNSVYLPAIEASLESRTSVDDEVLRSDSTSARSDLSSDTRVST